MTNGMVCSCSASDISRYRSRLSGPLADRIDLHVTVRSVPTDALVSAEKGESSETIRARVIAARDRQRIRYASRNTDTNAGAPARWLLSDGGADSRVLRELATLGTTAQLSARGFDRVIRVSRTIADLGERDVITIDDVREAVRYRGSGTG